MRRGLGPNGIGSHRGVCSRAVLDANCFWGSPPPELEALQGRGFTLSLSIDALREAWARSLRDNRKAALERRIAVIAPLLDPDNPIAFSGSLLLTMVGRGASAALHADHEQVRAALREGWHAACQGLTEERWKSVGQELEQELNREADAYEKEFERMRPILREIREVETAVGHDWYPTRRAEQIFENSMNGPVLLEPSPAQRLHLARRLVARKAVASRDQRPQRNDFVDWRLTAHVAWPAFLVTTDYKFIHAVDGTGSAQRAWVRAPIELLEDAVYRCEPWGKPARWVASRFMRQDLPALRARQDHARQRMKPQT